ncbi:MAG: GNAT family N-acetyltransferase [Clostridia bacterium]|nr:GNAT family N-acetyltransferase [Clostridia bacterium]
MIKNIVKADLPGCLKVFHAGYDTVAVEFGLTEENCPDRGRASLPMKKLISEFENGVNMYGYFIIDEIVGFLGIKMIDAKTCKLDDIIVLPEHRNNGYGKQLLDFCKLEARKLGARKIILGMIDDNKRLRKWYENNGFINIGYVQYDGASFIVGKMEYSII